EYLKENQEEPLIKKIIKNKTSFTKELEKFYRLKAEYGFEQALLQEKNKEYRKQAKTNKKSPEKTIDILQHLSQKDLNKTLLSYDKIMSEFIRNKKKENKETTKGVISLFGLTASIICAVAYHPIMIGFGTVMMFSLLGSITKTFNSYEGESLKEYKNLYLTAEKADKIIEKNRRYYL
ncbi:MAG: hypothetical protein KKC26_01130, partial [Nanoarchaeota archaeon]|nr:hypothetical protein [Nanoarchaeota archaeon]